VSTSVRPTGLDRDGEMGCRASAERWPSSSGRWLSRGPALSVAGGSFVVGGRGGLWTSTTNTWTAGAFGDWRSRARPVGTVWLARAGLDAGQEGHAVRVVEWSRAPGTAATRCYARTRCCTTG
jgi:hypothetical protein